MSENEDSARATAELRARVARLETLVLRAAALGASVAIALGFLVPFLRTSDEASAAESIRLLGAVFAMEEAGQGPFRSEAVLASIVVGMFALVAAATFVALLMLQRSLEGNRRFGVVQALSTTLLVGCGGAWLLVLLLAGHSEGEVSSFSPAVAWLTVGSLAGMGIRYLAPPEYS
ncbi:hypothetical protein [Amycolatopsis cihanbeyliensis]|uniref:hypothetical protein n=1 Tax=Amycolatopsis cihanbeyliensis TaxID=1128664 RepID=UPI00114FAB5D|nr:hypothetical protein [Amycolatopsis cihanbeyliensis]